MAITDLTNTKWVFNDVLDTEGQNITFHLNFQSNNENFTQLQLYNDSSYPNEMWYRTSSTAYVYENGWSLPLYKTILITGGTDATNSDLITWLQNNAVQDTGVLGVWKFNWTLDMTTYDWNTFDINFTAPYAGDDFKTSTLAGIRTSGDYNPAGTDRLYYIYSGGQYLATVYSNTEFTYKWQNSGARVIFISGGDHVYSDALRDFLEPNATQLFLDNISDLTNTTWEFYNDLVIPSYSSQTTYNLDFTCNFNGTEITCDKIIIPSGGAQINYYCTSPQQYEGILSGVFTTASGWQEEGLRTIKITGGSNAATAEAIQFIQLNAKQILTYITTDKELGSIADAIREKGNTSAQLVYPAGFVSAIYNIPTGGDPNAELYKQWALNYIESAQESFCFKSSISSHYNLLYNLSDTIESGAFAQRNFSGDFTFNSLTVVPSYAFAMISPPYEMQHTFNFPNCSIIGLGAFLSRRTLTSINIPTVKSICSSAFYQCVSLANANISNCTVIEGAAFYQCIDLYSISIPKCTYIGQQAFRSTGLSEIYGPSCSIIGQYAFAYCSRLIIASFPECQLISSNAFYSCSSSLTTVDFSICSFIYNSAFAYCYKLSSISFPKAKNIFQGAFVRCSLLTTISFPECTSISANAFSGCSKLQSVYLLGSQVVSLGTSVFHQTPITNSTYTGSFGSIYVPSSLLDTYKSSTNWAAISARLVGM